MAIVILMASDWFSGETTVGILDGVLELVLKQEIFLPEIFDVGTCFANFTVKLEDVMLDSLADILLGFYHSLFRFFDFRFLGFEFFVFFDEELKTIDEFFELCFFTDGVVEQGVFGNDVQQECLVCFKNVHFLNPFFFFLSHKSTLA
jgi:hypothetical protein